MRVSTPATGMGLVGVPGTATGGSGVSKASERLSNSSWSRTVGHSPRASCRLLGVVGVFATSPNLVCMGVCLCNSLANFKLDQTVSRRPWVWEQGLCWYSGGTHECGDPVRCLCECMHVC